MKRNVPRPSATQLGFTLLEIMVVVVLIGLSATVIVLNLERDVDQVAEQEARRFASLLEYVRDESILTGRLYGIDIDESERRYEFKRFDGEWRPVERDDVLRPRTLPEYLGIRFDSVQRGVAESLLVIGSLGEIQPFFLTISGEESDFIVNLGAMHDIVIRRKQHESG